MPVNKDHAGKDLEELSDREAAELAYSHSTVSLDDYDPDELDGPDDPNRVVERGSDRKSMTIGDRDAELEKQQAKSEKQDKSEKSKNDSDEVAADRKANARVAVQQTERHKLAK